MNKIQQYILETESEFYDLINNLPKRVSETPKDILNTFIKERQLGLIELVRGLVPKENNYGSNEYGMGYETGWNDCREQMLKNLELKDE